jgi:hypothetical protein
MGALAVLFLVTVSTTGVEAQPLDGMWIKLNATANGPSVIWDGVSGFSLGKNVAFKANCYMKIEWDGTPYIGRIACPWSDGHWYDGGTLYFDENLVDGNFWSSFDFPGFWNNKGSYVYPYGQFFLVPVFKNSVLTQVKLSGKGATSWGYVGGSGNTFGPLGSYNVVGNLVKETAVPQQVRDLFP